MARAMDQKIAVSRPGGIGDSHQFKSNRIRVRASDPTTRGIGRTYAPNSDRPAGHRYLPVHRPSLRPRPMPAGSTRSSPRGWSRRSTADSRHVIVVRTSESPAGTFGEFPLLWWNSPHRLRSSMSQFILGKFGVPVPLHSMLMCLLVGCKSAHWDNYQFTGHSSL